jgi:uncharacterized DUF497 family protein
MKGQKHFNWNPEKNQVLLRERGISFERIVFEIASGNELAVLEHPNQEEYPGQKISMVQVEDYVYAVPFIETDLEFFLKTIIPSRKATKKTGVAYEPTSTERRGRVGDIAGVECGFAQACQQYDATDDGSSRGC